MTLEQRIAKVADRALTHSDPLDDYNPDLSAKLYRACYEATELLRQAAVPGVVPTYELRAQADKIIAEVE